MQKNIDLGTITASTLLRYSSAFQNLLGKRGRRIVMGSYCIKRPSRPIRFVQYWQYCTIQVMLWIQILHEYEREILSICHFSLFLCVPNGSVKQWPKYKKHTNNDPTRHLNRDRSSLWLVSYPFSRNTTSFKNQTRYKYTRLRCFVYLSRTWPFFIHNGCIKSAVTAI